MTELATSQGDSPRTKQSRLAVRVVSALGAITMIAAAYRMAGGPQELLGAALFVIWGLFPFVIAAHVIGRPNVGIVRTVGLVLACGFDLSVYAQLCLSKELSSTAGLAFIFIPLWQLVGMVVVLLVTRQWRKK